MMKPLLVPLYFEPGRDSGFDRQLEVLHRLFGDEAEFLPSMPLGAVLPAEADAAVFPQFLGEGYRRLEDFRRLDKPILVVTSEFGTMSMWDWELIDYLRGEGIPTLAPYSVGQARKMLAALRVRKELRRIKFLVYQDNPGEGQQAPIFKRFYWWESECTQRMAEKFGITIEKRSFRELGARAKAIPDADAVAVNRSWQVPVSGLSGVALNNATKMYLAIRKDLDADPNVRAVGMNCLNESHFANTTPCLAWNRLYLEDAMIWGCEGDTVSMLTKYILHRSLGAPTIMTNLYPFLMGQAALKHERIPAFPSDVKGDPRDYVLVAHCGYMGVIPQSFATEWTLKKKVLAIVDEEASAIDARLPVGKITLAKMHATFDRLTVIEGELEGYAQYPGSDCLNGGVLHIPNGHRFMTHLASHHYLLMTGEQYADIDAISPIFGCKPETL